MKTTRSIVVVYENTEARKQAVEFCDGMMSRFWTQCELDIHWWVFPDLEQPGKATEAAAKAATADVVVVAGLPETELPSSVQLWLENWSCGRGEREGLFAALLGSSLVSSAKQVYLRAVAHRAGLDFFTQVPDSFAAAFPETTEPYNERAAQVTGVLEEILHRQRTPPRAPRI